MTGPTRGIVGGEERKKRSINGVSRASTIQMRSIYCIFIAHVQGNRAGKRGLLAYMEARKCGGRGRKSGNILAISATKWERRKRNSAYQSAHHPEQEGGLRNSRAQYPGARGKWVQKTGRMDLWLLFSRNYKSLVIHGASEAIILCKPTHDLDECV